jgi:hypothetical protein
MIAESRNQDRHAFRHRFHPLRAGNDSSGAIAATGCYAELGIPIPAEVRDTAALFG